MAYSQVPVPILIEQWLTVNLMKMLVFIMIDSYDHLVVTEISYGFMVYPSLFQE